MPEPERDPASGLGGSEILGPVRMHGPGGGELSFFGMFATFDTPFEVTTSELAIELLFPADRATAELLENLPTDPDELLALAREQEEPHDLDRATEPTRPMRRSPHPRSSRRRARGACFRRGT